MLGTIVQRLGLAFFTLPTAQDWLEVILLFGVFALAVFLIGFTTGFLKVDLLPVSWNSAVQIAFLSLFVPGIFEEVLFRVIPLPHPLEEVSAATQIYWAFGSLVIFIIGHPFYGLISSSPSRRATSLNPIYLVLAGLLGVVCTLAYYESGSFWPPLLIHWFTVVVWLLVLGGYKRIIV